MPSIRPILLILVLSVIFFSNGAGYVSSQGSCKPASGSQMTQPTGSLSGYVTDTFMNPLGGALIRVTFHETYEENYSNSAGYYQVTNIPLCWCMKNVTCSKPGFQTQWVLLGIDENTTYDFILVPLSLYPHPELNGTRGENSWYVSPVTITFVGENYTYFRLDEGNWTLYTEPFVLSTDGVHRLEATYDFEYISDMTIKIDQTAPTCNFFVKRIGLLRWRLWAVVSDETSGINRVEFYVDSRLVGTITEAPYQVVWIGVWFFLWLKYLNTGDVSCLPLCMAYDNAGHCLLSPMPSALLLYKVWSI